MKARILKKAQRMLKQAGLRRTQQRVDVLGVLLNAKRPLTAEQIGRKLRSGTPDKVTIYRVLENFLHAGLVHRAYLADRSWHYELSDQCTELQCHPHFTCTKCGSTRCMVDSTIPMVKGLEQGFVVHRQQVRLEGLCPGCA